MAATTLRSLPAAQLTTVVLLFGGYAACYFRRADLSVVALFLIEDLGTQGILRGCYLTRDSVYSEAALLRRKLTEGSSK